MSVVRKSPLSILVLAVVFLFVSVSAPAQEMRVALVDFVVHSDNPKYTYLGKGISEMIAMELANSPGVALVDREERTELMEEMKFALSGLADDTERKMEVGRMLAADYIVFGEIVDMAPQLLISIRVTGVDSGEVVYQDNVTERPGRYEYISGYFASKILDHFDVRVARSTEKKVEEKEEKQEAAVVAFSRALAAYDTGEEEEAKKELVEAKKLDPTNEAVLTYIRKLAVFSPRFRVELERYALGYNPAALAFSEKDEIYMWMSTPMEKERFDVGDGYAGKEASMAGRAGYSMPLADKFGLAFEFNWSHEDNKIESPSPFSLEGEANEYYNAAPTNVGACAALGYRLFTNFSIGASFHYFNTGNLLSNLDSAGEIVEGYYLAGDIGFLLRTLQNRLVFDMRGVYTNQREYYLDEKKNTMFEDHLPLSLEGSLTSSFIDRTMFLSLKGVTNFYYVERNGYFTRLLTLAEYRMWKPLSLRLGYEFAYIDLEGRTGIGNGYLGGITLYAGDFEINFNYTYRLKPLSVLPGRYYHEHFLLTGVTYSPTLFTR